MDLIERSNGLCERCQNTVGMDGVIHHKAYIKKLTACLYICKKCHEEIHILQGEKKFLKRMINWMVPYTDDTLKKVMHEEALKRLLELGKDYDIPTEEGENEVLK